MKSRKPIFGYRMMAFSLLAIVVLGFTVWAHHMFVSGMQDWIRVPMMITTAIIAVPTGIKIFSWLATLWRGVLHLDTPMLFALGFLTMFTLGGISGVMLAMIPVTIHVSDTYFIVAHIHYVLFGGSLFTIFAGVYYWFPKMTGRMYDERLGKLHFWTTFVFFNLTFAPMHLIGIQGMPRRVADYADQFATWNLVISIASFVLGLSTLVFLYNMVASWRGGPRAVANPWRALTLEWQVVLAAADLQLRRGPDRRRRPVRVRRPGRGARRLPKGGARSPQPAGATPRRQRDRDARRGVTAMTHDPRRRERDHRRRQAARDVRARARQADPTTRFRARRAARAARATATSSTTTPSSTPRRSASTSRAVYCAREGIDADRRGRRPRPVHGDDGRGRRVPARRDHHLDAAGDVLGLAAARPHRAHPATRPALPVDARRHRPRRRGPALRGHARRRQPHRRHATSCCARMQGDRRARPSDTLFIVVVPLEGGDGRAAAARARAAGQHARPHALARACSRPA